MYKNYYEKTLFRGILEFFSIIVKNFTRIDEVSCTETDLF
jgi:hypothetical protein